MYPARTNNQALTFIARLPAVALLVLGCHLIEDNPDTVSEDGSTSGGGAAECLEAANENQLECIARGMQWIAIWDGQDATMLLIDDPEASIGVGGGVLVQVNSSADWVGNYEFDGGSCVVGCSWCQLGQSFCVGGFDEAGYPECAMYLGPEVANQAAACSDFLLACKGGGGSVDETGADETGGAPEAGAPADEDATVDDSFEYGCSDWDPSDAAVTDERGTVYLDLGLAGEIADNYGDPLALCDDTRFSRVASGHYAIRAMSKSGVLAQMGLQPGDVILNANGVEMNSLDAIANMTVDIFYGQQIDPRFTVMYKRGRARQQLTVLVQ